MELEPIPYNNNLAAEGSGISADNTFMPSYEVTVRSLNYGYIVTVGCNSFAIETSEDLTKSLTAYFLNPRETTLLWHNQRKLPHLMNV